MTKNRKYITWNGSSHSTVTFDIIEGLMHKTVNSHELLNIFTYAIPNLQPLNTNNNLYSAAFADDLIIFYCNKSPATVQSNLEMLVNKVNSLYKQCNLIINPDKSENILFYRPLRLLGQKIRHEIKNFQICIHCDNTTYPIRNKKSVKYLRMTLEYLLRLTPHVTIQL
ncbi:hypothetical protein M0804_006611 [Polistes exclamans]|nr:hypothetical protein M0804_006611 [Polistes exclamans]